MPLLYGEITTTVGGDLFPVPSGGNVAATDHESEGMSILAEQYKDSPLVRAWIASFLEQTQAAEVDVLDLLDSFAIDQAEGDALRRLAVLVGEPDSLDADASLRRKIKVRVLVNISNGKASEIAQIVNLWVGAGLTEVKDYPPASFTVTPSEVLAKPADLMIRLRQAKGAGIRMTLIYMAVPLSESFQTSPTYNSEVGSTTQGLSSSHDLTFGGRLASVLG